MTDQDTVRASDRGAPADGEWPSVTAVVPTRDRPVLLRRAVRAILGQDYPGHVECLVVFDQSEPEQLDVTVPAGRSLRVVRNVRRPGLAGARNTGILAAGTELVGFCDDDDEWLPGKLLAQVRGLQDAPGAALASSGIYVAYRGRDTARLPRSTRLDFADFLRDRHMEIHPCTFLARRQTVLDGIGLVDEAIPGSYGEDYEWLLRAARLAPVVAVPEPLVRVHWHTASFFTSKWRTIIDGLVYLLQRYPEFASEPAGLARIEGQVAFAHAALGERHLARQWARRSLWHNAREKRSYLALVVSTGVLRADWVMRAAQRAGRGI